jgi:uncharacterized membrane protein
MNLRLTLPAACLAGVLSIGAAAAQTAAPPTQTGSASLSHSAVKATTLKIATSVTNLVVLSAATGGVVGGTVLTVFSAVSTWLIYTGNDYLWDSYAPPPARQTEGESFDASGDVWRNTLKYLTFKPMVLAVKWASILVYTGSVTTMLVFGTASSVTNAVVFYANNVAWDFYDWYASAPPQPAVVQP